MPTCASDSTPRDGVINVVPQTGEIVALCLQGEFDLANAPALEDQIDRALLAGHNVILDLNEATFIDSSVIHVLVRASKASTGGEQAIVLQLGTAAIVEHVLELAAIEQLLPRARDRQEALRIIRQETAPV
jgi:anti-sigma B factor antagonist